MNSTTLTSLVSAIADYFFCALAKTEDFDTFCRDVRAGVNSAAAKAVGICIERFDAEVVARAPSSWAVHGVATRSIITLFGIVSYSRTLLRDEHGRNRYPTDEILGIPARARLSTEAFLWIVARCATVSFRQAARDFASVSGVEISAMCAWRAVQREGVLIKAYLRALRPGTISQADVFVECDGVYIAMQSPKRRKEKINRYFYLQQHKKHSEELKVGCIYAGKAKIAGRAKRGNVALYASFEDAEQFRCSIRNIIEGEYVLDDISCIHYASDAGSWCVQSGLEDMAPEFIQGLDMFHVMKQVNDAFPEGESRQHLVSLALRKRPEAFVSAIDRMLCQVSDASRRKKMRTCRDYVANHAELLRGGGPLGTMEATIAYSWAKRMKHKACAWSRQGAENMALVLSLLCANRPLVTPPKDVFFTDAQNKAKNMSVAKRGMDTIKQTVVGMGSLPVRNVQTWMLPSEQRFKARTC